jgi:glutamate dehydrogenase (NAD(P)+)
VTGKPIEIGGSLGRKEAAGRGVSNVTDEIAFRYGIPMKKAKYYYAGTGLRRRNGGNAFLRKGYNVAATSDMNVGVYNEKGLNTYEILKYV